MNFLTRKGQLQELEERWGDRSRLKYVKRSFSPVNDDILPGRYTLGKLSAVCAEEVRSGAEGEVGTGEDGDDGGLDADSQ